MQLPQAPQIVDAEVLLRPMKGGRNRALMFSARSTTGQLAQYIVKVPGLMENRALHPLPCLLELVAVLLAQSLQVRVPDCAVVQFGPELLEAVGQQLEGARGSMSLKNAIGDEAFLFGSAFEKAGPFLQSDLLDRDLRVAAAELLVFDVLVDNLDRSIENPNILQTRNELIAIDHGDAFSFLFPMIGGGAFPDGRLVSKHACLAAARKAGPGRFDGLVQRIAMLDDAVLEALRAAVPLVWQAGLASGKLDVILETIRTRRDTADIWVPELEARISQ